MGTFSGPAKCAKMDTIASTHPLLGEGKKTSDVLKADIGFLAMVGTYDPYDKKGRGKFLGTVKIVPGEEVELQKWYKEEVCWFLFRLNEYRSIDWSLCVVFRNASKVTSSRFLEAKASTSYLN